MVLQKLDAHTIFSLGLFESSAFYDYDNRKISKFK